MPSFGYIFYAHENDNNRLLDYTVTGSLTGSKYRIVIGYRHFLPETIGSIYARNVQCPEMSSLFVSGRTVVYRSQYIYCIKMIYSISRCATYILYEVV